MGANKTRKTAGDKANVTSSKVTAKKGKKVKCSISQVNSNLKKINDEMNKEVVNKSEQTSLKINKGKRIIRNATQIETSSTSCVTSSRTKESKVQSKHLAADSKKENKCNYLKDPIEMSSERTNEKSNIFKHNFLSSETEHFANVVGELKSIPSFQSDINLKKDLLVTGELNYLDCNEEKMSIDACDINGYNNAKHNSVLSPENVSLNSHNFVHSIYKDQELTDAYSNSDNSLLVEWGIMLSALRGYEAAKVMHSKNSPKKEIVLSKNNISTLKEINCTADLNLGCLNDNDPSDFNFSQNELGGNIIDNICNMDSLDSNVYNYDGSKNQFFEENLPDIFHESFTELSCELFLGAVTECSSSEQLPAVMGSSDICIPQYSSISNSTNSPKAKRKKKHFFNTRKGKKLKYTKLKASSMSYNDKQHGERYSNGNNPDEISQHISEITVSLESPRSNEKNEIISKDDENNSDISFNKVCLVNDSNSTVYNDDVPNRKLESIADNDRINVPIVHESLKVEQEDHSSGKQDLSLSFTTQQDITLNAMKQSSRNFRIFPECDDENILDYEPELENQNGIFEKVPFSVLSVVTDNSGSTEQFLKVSNDISTPFENLNDTHSSEKAVIDPGKDEPIMESKNKLKENEDFGNECDALESSGNLLGDNSNSMGDSSSVILKDKKENHEKQSTKELKMTIPVNKLGLRGTSQMHLTKSISVECCSNLESSCNEKFENLVSLDNNLPEISKPSTSGTTFKSVVLVNDQNKCKENFRNTWKDIGDVLKVSDSVGSSHLNENSSRRDKVDYESDTSPKNAKQLETRKASFMPNSLYTKKLYSPKRITIVPKEDPSPKTSKRVETSSNSSDEKKLSSSILSEEDSDSDSERSFKRRRLYEKKDLKVPLRNEHMSFESLGAGIFSQKDIIGKNISMAFIDSFSSISQQSSVDKSCDSSLEGSESSVWKHQQLPALVSSEVPVEELKHVDEVLRRIKEHCRCKNITMAIKMAKQYIAISSEHAQKDIFKELFKDVINYITQPGCKFTNDESEVALKEVMSIFYDYKLEDSEICSLIVLKCLEGDVYISEVNKLLDFCKKNCIPMEMQPISLYANYLNCSENSIHTLLSFFQYTKDTCQFTLPKDLINKALTQFINTGENCSLSEFKKVCDFVCTINSLEVEQCHIQTFIECCIIKDCWFEIAKCFQAWAKNGILSHSLCQGFASQLECAGTYYARFAAAVYDGVDNLPWYLTNLFGQIGVVLMLEAFSKDEFQAAMEILWTLHIYNINYCELQVPLCVKESTNSYYEALSDPSEVFIFSFTVAFTAIKICLHCARPKDGYKILKDFKKIIPENLNSSMKSNITQKQFKYLLKFVHLLYSIDPLQQGLDAFCNLLSMAIEEKDFRNSVIENLFKENSKDIDELFNNYLIRLMNVQKMDVTLNLYEHSTGNLKELLNIQTLVLRGLVTSAAEGGWIKEAKEFFNLGYMKQIYSDEKTNLVNFPWKLNVLSVWTTSELRLVLEFFIQKMSSALMHRYKKLKYENSFVVKVVFKEIANTCYEINCLKVSSSIDAAIKRTGDALKTIDSNFKWVENPSAKYIEIDPQVLYNYWKQNFPTSVEKIDHSKSFSISKKLRLSFGKNEQPSPDKSSHEHLDNLNTPESFLPENLSIASKDTSESSRKNSFRTPPNDLKIISTDVNKHISSYVYTSGNSDSVVSDTPTQEKNSVYSTPNTDSSVHIRGKKPSSGYCPSNYNQQGGTNKKRRFDSYAIQQSFTCSSSEKLSPDYSSKDIKNFTHLKSLKIGIKPQLENHNKSPMATGENPSFISPTKMGMETKSENHQRSPKFKILTPPENFDSSADKFLKNLRDNKSYESTSIISNTERNIGINKADFNSSRICEQDFINSDLPFPKKEVSVSGNVSLINHEPVNSKFRIPQKSKKQIKKLHACQMHKTLNSVKSLKNSEALIFKPKMVIKRPVTPVSKYSLNLSTPVKYFQPGNQNNQSRKKDIAKYLSTHTNSTPTVLNPTSYKMKSKFANFTISVQSSSDQRTVLTKFPKACSPRHLDKNTGENLHLIAGEVETTVEKTKMNLDANLNSDIKSLKPTYSILNCKKTCPESFNYSNPNPKVSVKNGHEHCKTKIKLTSQDFAKAMWDTSIPACGEEEFKKVTNFLKSKVLLKCKGLSSQEQQVKAVNLARTFVKENNMTSKLDKRTMKLLNEFADKTI